MKAFYVDINKYLVDVEHLIEPYVNIPEGSMFIKGYRLPVRNIKRGMRVHSKPTMPYVTAMLLSNRLIKIHMDNSGLSRHFKSNEAIELYYKSIHRIDYENNNPIDPMGINYYTLIERSDLNIIHTYLKSINNKTIKILDNELSNIAAKLYVDFKIKTEHMTIDIDGEDMLVRTNDDILAIRYREYCDYLKYNIGVE
jgi:hypothetical protein